MVDPDGPIASHPPMFEQMLDRVPVSYSVVDPVDRTVSGNAHFWRLFGYPDGGVEGLTVEAITHPDDRTFTEEYLDDMESGFVPLFETVKRYVRRDGSVFRGRLQAMPLMRADGSVATLVGVISELSPDNVPDSSNQLNAFVASVGHELRAPLHGIIGLVELLTDQTDLSENDRQLAHAIREQANSLAVVINDLLDYSSLYGGNFTPDLAVGSVDEVVDPILKMVSTRSTRDRARLRLDVVPAARVQFDVDLVRTRQIITNLVTNALRHTTSGPVTIAADIETTSPPEGPFRGRPVIAMSVTDDGPGIAPDLVAHIFEPFARAEQRGPGTGLGLSIARRLAHALGGTLDVETDVENGSTFTLRLAFVTSLPPTSSAPSDSPARPESRPIRQRILVAEDAVVNQLLATQQLRRIGHTAFVVENGASAVEAFVDALEQDEPFAAVLMDWYMPVMDGLQATQEIRRIEAERGATAANRTPIIGITANAMPGDRERCLAAGMDEFLSKPVSIDQLSAALTTWLPSSRPSETTPSATAATDFARRTMIDSATLDTLAEELGGRDITDQLLQTFARELDARLAPIRALLSDDEADLTGVNASAHTLKSTSALIGAHGFASVCLDLQRRTANHRPADGSTMKAARTLLELAEDLRDEIDRRLSD